MTPLVKRNRPEYVRLTEGRKPRRNKGMRYASRRPAADFDIEQSKKDSKDFAFSEKTLQEDEVQKESYADLTPVSNAAWKPFHRLLSKLMGRTKSRVTYNADAYQPVSEAFILKIPVDVLQVILDYLSPIDRTVLRYTCKPLYSKIRTAADDFPYFEEDKFAKMRVAARLLDTDLCPRIKHSSGTRYLTREELVTTLRTGSQCKLCDEFWPAEGKWTVRCPFHSQIPGGKGRSASSSVRRAINPLSWRKPYWERHPPSTFDEYVNIIKKEASRVTPSQCNHFSASYISSWTAALLSMETALYEKQHNATSKNTAQNAHGARLDSPSSTSLTPTCPPAPSNEIVTLTCCSHCMNVMDGIPGHAYGRACSSCGCTQCGWTDVRILRFPESVEGGFRVRYIPLGDVGDAGSRHGLRSDKGGRMLYGTIRFARRGSGS